MNKQRLGTSQEQLAERGWRLNPKPHFRLYLLPSFWVPVLPPTLLFSPRFEYPLPRSHCDEELHRNQLDMIRSTFQIGVASNESSKIASINDEILVLINLEKSFLCCFKGTFLSLSHLACQRPVTRLRRHPKITPILATTLTLFENRIK